MGPTGTHRELRRERDWGIAIDVDGDRRRRGNVGAEIGLVLASLGEDATDLRELEREGRARGVAGNGRVESVDDARAHLLEDDRAIVDEDRGLVATAVDAERRRIREALDTELPGVLVEAHDALAAGDADEVSEGPREIAKDARRVPLRDARGDVRSVDEEVEDLVWPHASPAGGGTTIDDDAST